MGGAVVGACGGLRSSAYLPLPLALATCQHPFALLGACAAAFLPPACATFFKRKEANETTATTPMQPSEVNRSPAVSNSDSAEGSAGTPEPKEPVLRRSARRRPAQEEPASTFAPLSALPCTEVTEETGGSSRERPLHRRSSRRGGE